MIESELIFGLKNSDRQALSVIYDKYYQDLYFYLLKFYSQEDLVQNAIHDMFIDLWNSRKSIGEIKSLKAYLLVSSRRKLFKLIKDIQLNSDQNFSYEDELTDIPFQYSHEDFLIEKEIDDNRRIKILEAINQLPSRQKEAVYLRYYEKLSVEEISLVQGINYQSVLNNLQRAYEVLRANPLIVNFLKAVLTALIVH
ncbi:RNA polymerase sigma factor [Algoriphagus aquimarinus]|uniref:RNA polymerase sigma factor, sigma-70 family n=1 Tax=Algoriphagus aquimarinus TaxID=237018 RepID=A0A1I0YBV0_9BACT|nr:sigma-70 family RNA polymerase sigma factor [Algoriphagus aquimarinus]SFB10226.1 RNA polymerase sigma factor, sigma-70 family [Algoriphagus aquimarinus]